MKISRARNVNNGQFSGFLRQKKLWTGFSSMWISAQYHWQCIQRLCRFLAHIPVWKAPSVKHSGAPCQTSALKKQMKVLQRMFTCSMSDNISNKKDIWKLLTGSNESSGLDPLRQFPVIFSSASVWTMEENKNIHQLCWQRTWRWYFTGINATYCFEPEILQRDREDCLRSWKRRIHLNELHYVVGQWRHIFFFFKNMEMLIVYLPHIEILLLFGLKKEAFVAVFDFTHLVVMTQTVS